MTHLQMADNKDAAASSDDGNTGRRAETLRYNNDKKTVLPSLSERDATILARSRKALRANPSCDYTYATNWDPTLCFVCAEERCTGAYAGSRHVIPVCTYCARM